jgi:hypothetical protein
MCKGCSKAPSSLGWHASPFGSGSPMREKAPARLLTHPLPPPPPAPFVAGRNLQLLTALGIPADPSRHRMLFPLSDRHRTTALHRLTTLNLTPKNFVVLAPATTRPQKHWVAERWAKLAERLWHQLRLPSLLLAGKSDRPLLARIARQSAVPLPLVDDLSLKESVALIEQAALLVGPDSFPIHAALVCRHACHRFVWTQRPLSLPRRKGRLRFGACVALSPLRAPSHLWWLVHLHAVDRRGRSGCRRRATVSPSPCRGGTVIVKQTKKPSASRPNLAPLLVALFVIGRLLSVSLTAPLTSTATQHPAVPSHRCGRIG